MGYSSIAQRHRLRQTQAMHDGGQIGRGTGAPRSIIGKGRMKDYANSELDR